MNQLQKIAYAHLIGLGRHKPRPESKILLTKKTYQKVLEALRWCKERNFDPDRKENPHLPPPDLGSSLEILIENTCRANKEHCPSGHARLVLEYLADKGILRRWMTGYTFPFNETWDEESCYQHSKNAVKAALKGNDS